MAKTLGNVNIGSAASFGESTRAAQLIDLSEKTKTAQIVRAGVAVPSVTLNPTKTVTAVESLVTVIPRFMPRVVSQSIPAGTKVPPGTAIDFVVVPKTDIPFDIFEGVHDSLATKNLDQVDDLVRNVAVRDVLLKHESADDVTPAEKTALIAAFQSKGITVDDAQPGKTFARAFKNIQGAIAFE